MCTVESESVNLNFYAFMRCRTPMPPIDVLMRRVCLVIRANGDPEPHTHTNVLND